MKSLAISNNSYLLKKNGNTKNYLINFALSKKYCES